MCAITLLSPALKLKAINIQDLLTQAVDMSRSHCCQWHTTLSQALSQSSFPDIGIIRPSVKSYGRNFDNARVATFTLPVIGTTLFLFGVFNTTLPLVQFLRMDRVLHTIICNSTVVAAKFISCCLVPFNLYDVASSFILLPD